MTAALVEFPRADEVRVVGGAEILARTPSGTSVYGFMPVVPMVLVSALLMFVVSKLTAKPSAATVEKYFSNLK